MLEVISSYIAFWRPIGPISLCRWAKIAVGVYWSGHGTSILTTRSKSTPQAKFKSSMWPVWCLGPHTILESLDFHGRHPIRCPLWVGSISRDIDVTDFGTSRSSPLPSQAGLTGWQLVHQEIGSQDRQPNFPPCPKPDLRGEYQESLAWGVP